MFDRPSGQFTHWRDFEACKPSAASFLHRLNKKHASSALQVILSHEELPLTVESSSFLIGFCRREVWLMSRKSL